MSQSMRLNINQLREAYVRGENITQILTATHPELERSEIIEIAYDIQSGSYAMAANDDPERLKRYANEIWKIGGKYLKEQDVVVDCGAGELTTLSALSEHLPSRCQLVACDISLSRLRVGRRFAERVMRRDLFDQLRLFVADMARLPLCDGSVDVVFTVHALEPNHGRECELLKELIRIARRQLLLFEPSWENSNDVVRARMEHHGYVRDLPKHIQAAGGHLVSVEPLPNPLNPLNPTHCYVVEPITQKSASAFPHHLFQCPLSGCNLHRKDGYWWSRDGGWAYPDIDNIACLREKHAVLMSHA